MSLNLQNFLASPLKEIDNIYFQEFDKLQNVSYDLDLTKNFESLFQNEEVYKQLQDFSQFVTYSQLQKHNGQIVKFTYMVQNIDDPELYAHLLINKSMPSQSLHLKYRENYSNDVQNFDLDKDSVLSERLSIYCVPIAGHNFPLASNQTESNVIMQIENEEGKDYNIKYKDIVIDPHAHISTYFDALKQQGVFNSNSSKSFPIIIKVYDSNKNLIKVNEVYEFIGILNYNVYHSSEIEDPQSLESYECYYPHNLIPRLHCFTVRKISDQSQEEAFILTQSLSFPINLKEIHGVFMKLLNSLTCNDELSSLFLLFGIINHFPQDNSKQILETIQKLVINIYQASKIVFLDQEKQKEISFAEVLSLILEKITCKSVYFPLELASLDKKSFISKKNYETNCLDIGKLQISSNTVVCIDETKMSAGSLNETGVKNIHFLNELLENQVLNFDFCFQELKVPCPCNVIICSEGKTFLKSNIQIPLENKNSIKIPIPSDIQQIISYDNTSKNKENEQMIYVLRQFIVQVRENVKKVEIVQGVSKQIEEDYVHSRKEDNSIGVEDLQRWIILAKIMSAWENATQLSFELFTMAKEIDQKRVKRNVILKK